MGMAQNLEEDHVGWCILGPYTEIGEGDQVKRTGRIMEVPVGEALLGRVVNPLGSLWTEKGPSKLQSTVRWNLRHLVSWTGSRFMNRCRRGSRRSIP